MGLILLASSVVASATLVTARGSLGGDDFFDWGQLPLTDLGTLTPLTTPAPVTSDLARSAAVTNSGGGLYRFNEGDGTYGGNFLTGDKLLFTLFDSGPISIDFSGLVGRAGAQIQAGSGQDFIGVISVFDALNVLLETHEVNGMGTDPLSPGDGSAIFIGIVRSSADIDRVEFSVKSLDPLATDFSVAINQLDFGLNGSGGGGGGGGVPEPTTAVLVGLGLLAAGRTRRSRKD